MSGPYGPQNTQELLERLVEEKGFMSHDDVAKWVDYVDAYIEKQTKAHGDMVIGEDQVDTVSEYMNVENMGLPLQAIVYRNQLRAEQRKRNEL